MNYCTPKGKCKVAYGTINCDYYAPDMSGDEGQKHQTRPRPARPRGNAIYKPRFWAARRRTQKNKARARHGHAATQSINPAFGPRAAGHRKTKPVAGVACRGFTRNRHNANICLHDIQRRTHCRYYDKETRACVNEKAKKAALERLIQAVKKELI